MRHVPDPAVWVVALLVVLDLQVLDRQLRHVEHRDLEVQAHRSDLFPGSRRRGSIQSDSRNDLVLRTAGKFPNHPFRLVFNMHVLRRLVLDAVGQLESAGGGVPRQLELGGYLRGHLVGRLRRLDLECEL